MSNPTEIIEQFDRKHGRTGIGIPDSGMIWYADGSARSATHWSGELVDGELLPERQRLKNVLKYHSELLRRAKRRFEVMLDNAKTMSEANAKHGGPPPLDMLAKVKELAAAVRQAKDARNKAKQDLAALTAPQDRAREAALMKADRESQAFIGELNNIKV